MNSQSIFIVTVTYKNLFFQEYLWVRTGQIHTNEAKERNPARWTGATRNWESVSGAWPNPPKELQAQLLYESEVT